MRYNNASEMIQSNSIHGIQNGLYSECSFIELPRNNDGNKQCLQIVKLANKKHQN